MKVKIYDIKDCAAHDADAMAMATTNADVTSAAEPVLIHAIRYEGEGWSESRRAELLAEFRRRLAK